MRKLSEKNNDDWFNTEQGNDPRYISFGVSILIMATLILIAIFA